ncbi:helix-turn-helix transcriptional regulator [Flexivirga sp. B27]
MEPQKWTTMQVADYLGVHRKTISAYRARGQMPAEDGRDGPRKPWWWSSTIIEWQDRRPGMGVGGGPKPRKQA